jgi:urease accessory protein
MVKQQPAVHLSFRKFLSSQPRRVMNNPNLFRLLHLADPALPIGGFAHSAGLETYVQLGIVKDKQTAAAFVHAQLLHNIRYTDAAFVSLAFDATMENNWKTIVELDELCTAVKLPQEAREASQKLGIRLLKIFEPLCLGTIGRQYKNAIAAKGASGHYGCVFGMYSALFGLAKLDALTAFYYNAASGFITNCVKLIPLGQQQGQELLFFLKEAIGTLVQQTMNPDPQMIGYCCAGFDIRSMQHERLYSRLYMS